MPLNLLVNGAHRHFETLRPGSNIGNLVEALELKSDRVALEHNDEIAPRSRWNQTLLSDEDKIELVHFVGGGAS